jgi:lipoprotein-releasing system ATP-binding protein
MMGAEPILRIDNLHKTYRKHAVEVPVLRGVSLDVATAEFLAVVGMSGSGKSTMLHLMGVLDSPDKGEVYLDGKRVDNLPAKQRDKLRNETFGYIFQFYHLLPELTMLENVMAPAMIHHSMMSWMWNRRAVRKKAAELIERVGLSHRLTHKPRELSGGEMQRAAIARALMNDPRVLLADEPTGNLDSANGQQIIALLRELNRDGLTIVMVTHHMELTHEADRIIRLTDGKVETETPRELSAHVQEKEPAAI